jgi:hypothetical protein
VSPALPIASSSPFAIDPVVSSLSATVDPSASATLINALVDPGALVTVPSSVTEAPLSPPAASVSLDVSDWIAEFLGSPVS